MTTRSLMKVFTSWNYRNHLRSWLLALCCVTPVHADTADEILKLPQNRVDATAKYMAESASRSLPAQIDAATRGMSALFVSDTRTLIFKYETTVDLDPSLMGSYLAKRNCADPISKALMYRGITYEHRYLTPSGERKASVTYKDCP